MHFNRGAEEIFGYAAADAIGRHLAVLLPQRFRDRHGGDMESFARSPVTARRMGERRAIFGLRANGNEFPAEASISKLVAPDGILFTVVLRDITHQKRAEEDERFLAAASAELAQTLAVESTLRAIVDLPIPRLADACMLDLNAPGSDFRRLSSTRQSSVLTIGLDGLARHPLTADSPSPVIDAIRRNRRELVDAIDENWLEGNADREAIPHWRTLGARALLILPLHSAGQTFGALTLVRTTDGGFDDECRAVAEKYVMSAATTLANAQLYDAARQANRARDEVLGIVSHDLRNPISAIAMCARVLRENPPGDDTKREDLLTTISESTEWMNRLIQDLVDVASIERGQLSLEMQSQDAAALAHRALHMFEVEAEANGISLEVQAPDDLPRVLADGARVIQVLGNLLRNAIKFTPKGGRIAIAVEARAREVIFSVSDTGRGIAAEHVGRVFERYWRGVEVRTGGSGLGLSIAKGIVEAQGGRIWVESGAGKGSVFAFGLPQVSSHEGK